MKLLFIVDGRSPIALNWIKYFAAQQPGAAGQHEVHIASMYPCQPDFPLASLTVTPVAFSSAVAVGDHGAQKTSLQGQLLRKIATPRLRTWLRQRFVPRSLPKAADALAALISKIQPDLIHAMRVPYEGMLAALACESLPDSRPPLLVSIWGNDFTLHAPSTREMTRLSRYTMTQASALHTDCYRDQPLAQSWGFDPEKPAVVLPGGGGIQLDVFYPPESGASSKDGAQYVVNPRGLRAYIRNDTFFKAIPRVLADHPTARFLCFAMQGQPEAEKWVAELELADTVDLLPLLPREVVADCFRQAQVVVSPSTHDGTPNTLLEALACGCFPVVGDIEPLREWITQGENGFLVDPDDPQALADAIARALSQPELRAQAAATNTRLIAERAEYSQVMEQAATFYETLSTDQ